MKPTLYDAARILTTAGMTADIKFDPTKITNRLKKSIQRQISRGVITGGWASHASRIAKILCKQYKIDYTDNSWYGIRVPAMPMEHRERFVELIQADLAAYLLDGDHYNPSWEKDRAAQSIALIRAGDPAEVRTYSNEYKDKLRALISELRTPDQVKHAQEIAAMLDSGEPINIKHHFTQGE